jgi:MFS family permease
LAASSILIGATFGSIGGGFLADKFGRKKVIISLQHIQSLFKRLVLLFNFELNGVNEGTVDYVDCVCGWNAGSLLVTKFTSASHHQSLSRNRF